jgi:putative endonuclease
VAEGGGDDWKKRLKALGLVRRRAKPGTRTAPAAPRTPWTGAHVVRGREGEDAAAQYLSERGVEVLARNVRYKDGELDLVCRDGTAVVFVEVKWRRNAERGTAAEGVTPRKRMRIVRAARRWLLENPKATKASTREVRFDVVAIEEEPFAIEWIAGAFDVS